MVLDFFYFRIIKNRIKNRSFRGTYQINSENSYICKKIVRKDGKRFIANVITHRATWLFSITKIEEIENKESKEKVLYIYLEEINQIPSAYDSTQYESKGFYAEKTIQDFPIRGKAVYLRIKRSHWRNKQTKSEIQNDYTFIAEGSKITKELSDFLKSTDWYSKGTDKSDSKESMHTSQYGTPSL